MARWASRRGDRSNTRVESNTLSSDARTSNSSRAKLESASRVRLLWITRWAPHAEAEESRQRLPTHSVRYSNGAQVAHAPCRRPATRESLIDWASAVSAPLAKTGATPQVMLDCLEESAMQMESEGDGRKARTNWRVRRRNERGWSARKMPRVESIFWREARSNTQEEASRKPSDFTCRVV
jgi:hypothetical protein